MSVYALVIVIALGGQIGSDRYGSPSDAASTTAPPPLTGATRSNVSPPPPFAPENRATPATMPDKSGYGAAATRPGTVSTPFSPPTSGPPASYSPPGANIGTAAPNSGVKPSTMMRSMLVAPQGSRLTGQPMRLAEVLAGATTRQEQSQRLEAYWDLCSSVADYYLGVREQDELQRLRASVSNVGPVWQQAESELGVRIGTSQRAAVASQYRLASLIGGGGTASLPLPADLPHCGDYYARYDQVFAGRQSPEAQQLSELLPMRYEELSDAALAVTRAEEFLDAIASQQGGDGTGTLRGLELLALRRRAFVQIARDYNRRIARYTELASPGQIDSGRLIGMLIMQGVPSTATRPATLVPPPNRQSQVPAEDPDQTFAEGWESIKSAPAAVPRDETVKPASAESGAGGPADLDQPAEPPDVKPALPSKPRREHSLLVPSE